MLQDKARTIAITTTAVLFMMATSPSSAEALGVTSTKTDHIVAPEDRVAGSVVFTQADDSPIRDFKFDWAPYDPSIDEFSLVNQSEIEINLGQTSTSFADRYTLDYTANIPPSTPSGSYFYVIYAELDDPVRDTDNTSVSIRPGVGHIIAIHVENERSLEQAYQDLEVEIEVTERGIPLIRETKFKTTFTNNSQFVYTPEGEVRISNGEVIYADFRINDRADRLYPGESFTQDYSTDSLPLGSYLEEKILIARVYNEYDAVIEERVILPGYMSLGKYLLGGFALATVAYGTYRYRKYLSD